MAQARVRWVGASLGLVLLAACQVTGTPAPVGSRAPRPVTKPSAAASVAPSVSTPPLPDGSATGTGVKPSPAASASPSAKPTTKPSPSPTPESGTLLPSVPPIVSPYTGRGLRWKYSVKVDTGIIPVDAELTTSVSEMVATGAVLMTGVKLKTNLAGLGGGTKTDQPPRPVGIPKSASNPFLALLGTKGDAEVVVKAAYDDTVTALERSIPCVKYLIEQGTGSTLATLRLWVAKEAGLGLVKEEIRANGLPDIGLSIPTTLPVTSKTTTTLLLVAKDLDPSYPALAATACPEPAASDAGASACAERPASDTPASGTI